MANTVIRLNTEAIGPVTRTSLSKRIKAAGGVRALASELNVSAKTVYSWQWRLAQRAKGLY